jgi:hypothetical protein
MRNNADVTGGKPIAVLLQPISGVSAVNPLVAFYDIHGGKKQVLLFCPGHHTRTIFILIDICFLCNRCVRKNVCEYTSSGIIVFRFINDVRGTCKFTPVR